MEHTARLSEKLKKAMQTTVCSDSCSRPGEPPCPGMFVICSRGLQDALKELEQYETLFPALPGDTLYVLSRSGKPIPCQVSGVELTTLKGEPASFLKLYFEDEPGKELSFLHTALGKTVFRTKKDAEAAGRKGGAFHA